jgi:glycosyltransferase involved in cell wall biosynthesis
MNILVFTNLFPNEQRPHFGIFIKQRVARYRNFGHRVRVLAPVAYYPFKRLIRKDYRFSGFKKEAAFDGIDVTYFHYLHLPKVGMWLQPFLILVSALWVLLSLRKEYRPDLVDAHYLYPDGVAASFLARVFRVPVILSARGSDVNAIFFYSVPRRLVLKSLSHSTRVVAVSNQLKETLVSHGVESKKIAVIPNGVDPALFYMDKELREKHKSDPICRILMVGNLIPLKGHSLLLAALGRLQATDLPFKLHVFFIGTGPQTTIIRQQARMFRGHIRVRLVGVVPHHKLVNWFNRADALCLLSEREGCPNVVLEALATGLPVLATKVGDLEDLITDDNGILIENRVPAEIAQALLTVMQRQWDREAIAEYGKRFDWRHIGVEVEAVFKTAATSFDNGTAPDSLSR